MSNLSPQMEKLLNVMRPGIVENPYSVASTFYGMEPGRYGYVNAGRGHGSGSLSRTFRALEARGLVKREGAGWIKVSE